ncbi:FlaG protein [Pseudodesulfovibrio hydrargyri]|uniref:FlaG protein n=1 Tax=Pseudodesulfovibrio hydrargyri TaxID=2125990 RepID=A0A1J5NB09_9BACT|nr:flagellar protein FlaG [Pseudodesulfovibrio hydrargyri]OIQ48929.1 FlaG protein [Pseudodesulfovibrio hydrargyri]
MNIPMMNIDMKQELRSESVVPAKAVHKPPVPDGSVRRDDMVMAQDEAQSDGQSGTPTREELNTLIAEAEEHLESKNIKLKFNILENNDTIQVEIIDSDGKTIRKIPEDDLLKLTKSLKSLGQGFLDKMS